MTTCSQTTLRRKQADRREVAERSPVWRRCAGLSPTAFRASIPYAAILQWRPALLRFRRAPLIVRRTSSTARTPVRDLHDGRDHPHTHARRATIWPDVPYDIDPDKFT